MDYHSTRANAKKEGCKKSLSMFNQITCINPDSAIDSNTDCSSCSSDEDITTAKDFSSFCEKITSNSTIDWTSQDVLKKLVEKQKKFEKVFSLVDYFGGPKLNQLHEINKSEEPNVRKYRKNKTKRMEMCKSFATPQSNKFLDLPGKLKGNKENFIQKKSFCKNKSSKANTKEPKV
ncbi:unnamed protein product [Moneuplotes crassus]|uniref:Uncharacterized protein n=1 Tax=Euplotes crassus TaxID=5936 RepID=A0AAD1UF42_EUPCR|nr:unnamed protein product [Moneuplotes crassus]